MNKDEALRMALEALEWSVAADTFALNKINNAITAIKEALAQPEQEPNFCGVLFAVEEAIRNGDCPWQIESAFDEYEAERKAAHGIKGEA